MAALDAIYPASQNPMAFPHLMLEEGLQPHAIPSVYLFWSDEPNAWVDTSDTMERKVAALQVRLESMPRHLGHSLHVVERPAPALVRMQAQIVEPSMDRV